MAIRKDTRPSGQYAATDQALDLAELVAKGMGQPFDRNATRTLAATLYEDMFADLVRVLKQEHSAVRFHSGVFQFAGPFSAKDKEGGRAILFDMVFDFWVFSLSHISLICTFNVPPAEEQEQIASDIQGLFELFANPREFKSFRERIARYLIAYPAVLNISAALARAVIVFVLCHELAHINLGHLNEATATPQDEIDADTLAVSYFLNVVEHGKAQRETLIHVDQKVAFAPIAISMLLEFYEAWLQKRLGTSPNACTHPPAAARTDNIRNIMADGLTEIAQELVGAMTLAIDDLHHLLGLKNRRSDTQQSERS